MTNEHICNKSLVKRRTRNVLHCYLDHLDVFVVSDSLFERKSACKMVDKGADSYKCSDRRATTQSSLGVDRT